MKKILSILLSAVLAIGLVACGNTNKGTTNNESKSEASSKDKKEEKNDKVKNISVGEKINGKQGEILINKIEFSYDVVPDKKEGVYTHYPAKSGKVYINVDIDVKNTQKQELPCNKVMGVEADYNNGYKYTGEPIVEDPNLGFTYANITKITPLETRGMRFIIDCPQEVEGSKNSLILNFDVDGQKYQYKMR